MEEEREKVSLYFFAVGLVAVWMLHPRSISDMVAVSQKAAVIDECWLDTFEGENMKRRQWVITEKKEIAEIFRMMENRKVSFDGWNTGMIRWERGAKLYRLELFAAGEKVKTLSFVTDGRVICGRTEYKLKNVPYDICTDFLQELLEKYSRDAK